MRSLRSRAASFPAVALFALAAFGLHQLRYVLAGAGGSAAAVEQSHEYLGVALPVIASIAVAVVASALTAAAIKHLHQPARGPVRVPLLSLAYAVALVALFAVQELGEAVLSAERAGGVEAIAGHGGWVVLPLAAAFGVLLALVLDALAVVQDRVAGTLAFSPRQRAPLVIGRERRSTLTPLPGRALVFGFARRPPPPFAS
jgi:hypothetical protein